MAEEWGNRRVRVGMVVGAGGLFHIRTRQCRVDKQTQKWSHVDGWIVSSAMDEWKFRGVDAEAVHPSTHPSI